MWDGRGFFVNNWEVLVVVLFVWFGVWLMAGFGDYFCRIVLWVEEVGMVWKVWDSVVIKGVC